MIMNEENIANHMRQLDIIGQIPSNKFDVPDLSGLTSEDMLDSERRHLNELAEQTRRYDETEQQVVAENLDPFICFNAVGKWMNDIRNQLEAAKQVFSEEEN